jgi:hypothetical protein
MSPLLTPELIEKLKKAKVFTVMDFVAQDPEHLTLKAGMPYKVSINHIFNDKKLSHKLILIFLFCF